MRKRKLTDAISLDFYVGIAIGIVYEEVNKTMYIVLPFVLLEIEIQDYDPNTDKSLL